MLPLFKILLIPLRIGGLHEYIFAIPAWLFVLMMTFNVLLQQYLTFGILQSYLNKCFSGLSSAIITALLLYGVHWLYLADMFSPLQPFNALYILALGFIFAMIQYRTKTLHINVASHLLFYFVFI